MKKKFIGKFILMYLLSSTNLIISAPKKPKTKITIQEVDPIKAIQNKIVELQDELEEYETGSAKSSNLNQTAFDKKKAEVKIKLAEAQEELKLKLQEDLVSSIYDLFESQQIKRDQKILEDFVKSVPISDLLKADKSKNDQTIIFAEKFLKNSFTTKLVGNKNPIEALTQLNVLFDNLNKLKNELDDQKLKDSLKIDDFIKTKIAEISLKYPDLFSKLDIEYGLGADATSINKLLAQKSFKSLTDLLDTNKEYKAAKIAEAKEIKKIQENLKIELVLDDFKAKFKGLVDVFLTKPDSLLAKELIKAYSDYKKTYDELIAKSASFDLELKLAFIEDIEKSIIKVAIKNGLNDPDIKVALTRELSRIISKQTQAEVKLFGITDQLLKPALQYQEDFKSLNTKAQEDILLSNKTISIQNVNSFFESLKTQKIDIRGLDSGLLDLGLIDKILAKVADPLEKIVIKNIFIAKTGATFQQTNNLKISVTNQEYAQAIESLFKKFKISFDLKKVEKFLDTGDTPKDSWFKNVFTKIKRAFGLSKDVDIIDVTKLLEKLTKAQIMQAESLSAIDTELNKALLKDPALMYKLLPERAKELINKFKKEPLFKEQLLKTYFKNQSEYQDFSTKSANERSAADQKLIKAAFLDMVTSSTDLKILKQFNLKFNALPADIQKEIATAFLDLAIKNPRENSVGYLKNLSNLKSYLSSLSSNVELTKEQISIFKSLTNTEQPASTTTFQPLQKNPLQDNPDSPVFRSPPPVKEPFSVHIISSGDLVRVAKL